MSKKLLVSSMVAVSLLGFNSVNAGYEEIECSTDSVFSEYSCSQCFNWGEKGQDSYIGLLEDLWKNNSWLDQLMYKELQSFPEMVNLNTSKVEWKQTPSAEGFWEYTEELNSLHDSDKAGYVLKAWKEVVWVKSKLGSAYHLAKNEAAKWENIWMIVFPITSYNIMKDWEVSSDSEVHKECVLIKSGNKKEVVKEKPKTLPKTGPEQFLLLLVLAMVLAFGVLRFRKS